jgi:hypothetical protein
MLRICVFTASCLAAATTAALPQNGKAVLEPDKKWTNFAAGSKEQIKFTVKASGDFKGRVDWRFTTSPETNRRVIPGGTGSAEVTANAKKPASVTIPLAMPPVKEGVILETQLIVGLYAAGEEKPQAEYKKTFWLFPADPFFDRSKWFEGLKITLFDPEAKSHTGETLTKLASLKDLKTPFEHERNARALADVKEGMILVAEGVSFKDEAGLAEVLVKAAGRGIPVLCLAPKDGSIPLPVAGSMLPMPASLALHRLDVIAKLDKRLDAAAWAPRNDVAASSLAVKADDNKVIAEISNGGKNWPWLQLDYPDAHSRLVVCGAGIIRQWDDSRTARFLLARLLEYVTELTPQ